MAGVVATHASRPIIRKCAALSIVLVMGSLMLNTTQVCCHVGAPWQPAFCFTSGDRPRQRHADGGMHAGCGFIFFRSGLVLFVLMVFLYPVFVVAQPASVVHVLFGYLERRTCCERRVDFRCFIARFQYR